MVPLGLWKDMRLPSFFSGVFFWPVSESKRGKVRITFMFLSPQLVTSCRFPAPWVDSSFVNSERASQPAIWAVSAGPLPLPLSRSLTHSLRCAHSLPITPSSLSIPSPRPPCGAATAAKTLRSPRSFCCVSRQRERAGRPPSGHCHDGDAPEKRRQRGIQREESGGRSREGMEEREELRAVRGAMCKQKRGANVEM